MMKQNKEAKTYRLSKHALSYIDNFAAQNGITNTAAVEKIIKEHETMCNDQGEQIAALVVNKLEEKYVNMFTRMRLATTMADRNIQVVLEILNTILITQCITNAFTSNMTKSQVWQECEAVVKEQIAKYKQLKDHKKN